MNIVKKNNKHKGLTKSKVLLASMATVLCSVPVAIGVTEVLKNSQSTSYNSLSNSFLQLQNNVEKQTLENDGTTWKVTLNNGEVKVFNSPEELRKSLLSNSSIIEETYSSNIDLNTLTNKNTGVLDIQNNPNIVKGKVTNFNKTIYKGKNSEILFQEDKAKESYFDVNAAYNFDGMYFKDKIDLKNYLSTEYVSKDKIEVNSIVLEGPNGIKSTSINLNSPNAISEIDLFIESNVKKIVNYKNSITNESINITKENVDSVLNSVSTKDIELSHIQSNQGESRYVIDNHVSDDYDLIGPYFYKGNLDIGAFMNKNMWKKVNGVSKQVYQQSQVDKVIGSFFSSIINDDNGANLEESSETSAGTTLFRTPLLVGKQNIDDWFLNMIGDFNVGLKELIVNTNKKLIQGKKYNTFYKIPILYNFILQRLFNLNAPHNVLQNTIDYFKKICNFIQGAIEVVVIDSSFLIGKDGKKIDMIELFQIGNSEFDTNTSVEYFLNKLKTNYPSLIGAMSSYMGGVNNIYLYAGMLPFSSYDQKYLVEFGIMPQEVYNENKTKYSQIYEIFSQPHFKNLLSNYVKFSDKLTVVNYFEQDINTITSKLDEIKLDKMNNLSLKEYLVGIGAKNSLSYNIHNAAIRDELLELANYGGYIRKGSYLDAYIRSNNSLAQFISNFRIEMVKSFVRLAKINENNPDFDFYKSYLALLIDSRMSKWDNPIFSSTASFNNDYELAKNVTRLVNTSLVTAGLAAESIRLVYSSGRNIVSLTESLRNAIKNRWTQIKHSIPSVMRTWNVNLSTTFTVKKWSLTNIFSKIGKGIDVLKGAAPIFGAAFLGFEVFLLVFELLRVETTTNFYVYTTADGTEFIWNGGRTVSRYFGFDVKETNGISSMKLVEPIQITLPQVEEFYFFNGIKYYDPNQAKKGYLQYILSNNDLFNKNFSTKYVFEKNNDVTNSESFDSIEKLKDSVFKSLNINRKSSTINVKDVNFDSKYIAKISYKYGNMVSFNPNALNQAQKDKLINDVLNNIREVYFAKLPQFFNKDSSIVIPGIVWSDGKKVDNRSKMNEYVINTLANETINGTDNYKISSEIEAKKASKENLKLDFMKNAIVDNKVVFSPNNYSSILLEKYENISSNIKEYKVYTVFKPGKGKYQFLDKAKAEKFAMDYKSIEKQFTTKVVYVYNDMVFSSQQELENWIKNNGNI